MQTTANTGLAAVDRITTAAHLTNQRVAMPSIIAYDYRIRNFALCASGGLTYANDFSVVTNASGEVVRARTLADGTLDIRYATLGATITWSSNTVAITSKSGYGIALNGTGTNALECYFLHTDGVTIKRITSSDGGHTWSASATVATLGTQTKTVYLTSPTANMVLIGDTVNGDTRLMVAIYSGGAWSTQYADWSASLNADLSIFGQTGQITSSFAAYSLGSNEYVIAMYAKAPRGHINDGIYTERVSNLVASQTPHWQQLQALFATNPGLATSGGVTYSTLYIAFPKIQCVGSEYWMTALEVSGYAGHNVQHLCYFRSTDGVHWVARQYLAGSDMTYTSGASSITFAANDLLNGQVIVGGAYIYLFGFDKAFRADATKQCGYDNSAKRLDISSYVVPPLSITESGAGQSASVTITLENPGGTFNNSTILRRGSVIDIAMGYYTSAGADETMQTIRLLVDEVRQPTRIGDDAIENRIEIQARNLIKLMQDDADKPDIFYSYESPTQTNLKSINDMTALNVFNGTWMTAGGELHGGLIDAGSPEVDNLAALAHLRGEDGVCELQFKSVIGGAWTNSYCGVALQITDNQNYYAVMFNYANDGGKTFGLYQAVPGTSGKVVAYSLAANLVGQTRSTTLASALAIGTVYYLRVQQWHNRVMAYYSTNRQTWTKVVDYAPVPHTISYFGVIQKGNVTASTPFGEFHQPDDIGLALTDGYCGMLNDTSTSNLGKAMSYFVRVKTKQAGILRSIVLALTRWDDPSYIPDTTVQLWRDVGNGAQPASLSDLSNKLFESTLPPSSIDGNWNKRCAWTVVFANDPVALDAETYYWICVKAAANLTTRTDAYGRTTTAAVEIRFTYCPPPHSDGQGLKALFQYNPADLVNFYDFQPPRGGLGSTPSFYMVTSYDASGIVIQGMNHSGGEYPQTIERIANDLCVKSGITGFEPDSWITDTLAAFSNGADGSAYTFANDYSGQWAVGSGQLQGYHSTSTSWAFVRSNTYYGARGDGMLEVYLTMLAASKRAGVLVRASGATSALTSGYIVDVSTDTTPMVSLSKIVSGTITLLYSTPSLVAIPTNAQFKLNVLLNAGQISVYINECLAGVFWDTTITAQGEIGLAVYGNASGGAVCKFANLRVPDVWKVKATFDVAENASWQSALNNLIGKDRVSYFVRASGALRLATFSRRASVDTYDATIVRCTKVDSDRYWASHIRPEGDRFADRFDATMLASDWRRFRKEDYTDAFTDEQAYDDAAVPLRNARERTIQYELESAAVPAAECEDVIALTNPLDGTSSGQYIINDRTITFDLKEAESNELVFKQTLGLRSFSS